MKHILSLLSLALFLAVPLPPGQAQAPASAPAPAATGIRAGQWKGSLAIRKDSSAGNGRTDESSSLQAPISVKILEQGRGALMDIPEQSMHGYPLDQVSWTSSVLRFSFGALGPDEELLCEGVYVASLKAILGTAKSRSWKGSFRLALEEEKLQPGEFRMSVDAAGLKLPGTLLSPQNRAGEPPLVILLSGSGNSDRNGNNFSVPGLSNSLALLAQALRVRGVASFRYDKRGSGEAYSLVLSGVTASLQEQIEDATEIILGFLQRGGFSRYIVAGVNEGAWIGAAAVNALAEDGVFVDGLVGMTASGEKPENVLRMSLEGLDPRIKEEAELLIKAIIAGEDFLPPSPVLADFFSSSRIPWLKSWLSFNPAEEFSRLQVPVLLLYGEKDMQVSPASFEKLLDALPHASARMIPSMNYALKQVDLEEENFDSFTNPDYPVPDALSELLAAFAKVRPLPPGSRVYTRSIEAGTEKKED